MDVADVRRAYVRDKRLTLMQIEPGLFVIVIPNQHAYEHYELVT